MTAALAIWVPTPQSDQTTPPLLVPDQPTRLLLSDGEAKALLAEIKVALEPMLLSRRWCHAAEEILQNTFLEILRRLKLGRSFSEIYQRIHIITHSVRCNWFRGDIGVNAR